MLKNSKKEEIVKICPKCGSENIEIDKRVKLTNFYVCKNCGFGSSSFPEIPKKWADKLQHKIKKRTLNKKLILALILFLLFLLLILLSW